MITIGAPVRVTLTSFERAHLEAAVKHMQHVSPQIGWTEPKRTPSNVWAAVGTLFIAPDKRRR